MKINFTQVINNLDGTPLKNEKNEDLTLGMVCKNALLMSFPDEQSLTGEEKLKRYDMAVLIHAAKDDTLDLTAERVAEIKKLVAKFYGPLVVGQAWKMLEGENA